MATTVFRNGRTERGLEIPATGYSSAIPTYLGAKTQEPVSVVCLSLLFPKLGYPEATTVSLFSEEPAPLSKRSKRC